MDDLSLCRRTVIYALFSKYIYICEFWKIYLGFLSIFENKLNISISIIVLGLVWTEIKQLWDEGAHEYVHDMWNILDFITNSLYIATLTLRVIAYLQVTFISYSLKNSYTNFKNRCGQ